MFLKKFDCCQGISRKPKVSRKPLVVDSLTSISDVVKCLAVSFTPKGLGVRVSYRASLIQSGSRVRTALVFGVDQNGHLLYIFYSAREFRNNLTHVEKATKPSYVVLNRVVAPPRKPTTMSSEVRVLAGATRVGNFSTLPGRVPPYTVLPAIKGYRC